MITIKNYAGLEYVSISTKKKSIPVDILIDIERDIAKHIVGSRPLRGKEILFLRKQLKLSCAKLSLALRGAFDASTISRWESSKEERLAPSNEMLLRVFFAQKFEVELRAEYDDLLPRDNNEEFNLAA